MADKINVAGSTSGDYIKLDNAVLDTYSQEILFQAQPALRFLSIVQTRTELETMPGNTIKFLKYNALTGKSAIAETQTIATDTISSSLISISVSEHAKAVAFSEFLLRSSVTSVLQDAAVLLGQHYAKYVDGMARDTLLTVPSTVYAEDRANRAALVATDMLDVDAIRAAVEILATNKAPKFDGDSYIGFVHPHQSRFLRKDPDWQNVNLYSSPEAIKNGEIGRIEDVRFIESTMIPFIKKNTQDIWADNVDTGDNTALAANAATSVYQAVICGEYALGMAVGLPVEMRDDGVHDFGRQRKLAYYGIWGMGLIESAHAVVIETA